ncbi:DNA polymerase III subunit delta' [Candidatus Phytoplasma solani]|uniref:DNA polymerase III subunit delta n=2 Tax=Candidatus Phytoplasma solani TaxID=69896 RepID=A0A421NYF2_9MOLU|nr:DNA polymerase III subunit delta' [Candidatus Phytoplasma solani]RMI88964.1 DNA polymerase III subunit delta' [Candidatus Phytoplasma solani]
MSTKPLLKQFLKIIYNNKLSHLYLITGQTLAQRKEFVFELSYQIFKFKEPQNEHLFTKQALIKGINTNFYYLNKDNQLLKKEQILQLQKVFHQAPLFGQERIYVIEKIEKTTLAAANSLLHFLENAPKHTIGFLLTSNLEQVLPTIVSRCQIINLNNSKFDLLLDEKKTSDSFDLSLSALINPNPNQQTLFIESQYYQHFKSFFLFFINNWQASASLKLAIVTFPFPPAIINIFADFLTDFISVLLRWFLDLMYEKNKLPLYFRNQINLKTSFQTLTLQQNINILEIIKRYHQKINHVVNPQNMLFALMIELEEQRGF